MRTIDHASGGSVTAGEPLKRGKNLDRVRGRGTASLVVRKPNEPNTRYLVTAAHVLRMATILEQDKLKGADAVYAPELSTCSKVECNSPIGTVVDETLPKSDSKERMHNKLTIDGHDYAVDASLIKLNGETEADNDVPEIGMIKDQPFDFIDKWGIEASTEPNSVTQNIEVRKFGSSTGLTTGTVANLHLAELDYWVPDPDAPPPGPGDPPALKSLMGQGLVFEVHASTSGDPIKLEYELDAQRMMEKLQVETAAEVEALFDNTLLTASVEDWPEDPVLNLEGHLFSLPGDSGAPVVNAANEIVGLLQGGKVQTIFLRDEKEPLDVSVGHSRCVLIRPCLERLGVEIMPSGATASGRRVARPGQQLRRGTARRFDRRPLDRAARRLKRTPMGSRLVSDAERHFEEMRDLVHHRRRVMVAWHRSEGPGFVAAAMTAAESETNALPLEVGSTTSLQLLTTMRDVLRREGSLGLQTALERHEGLIVEAIAASKTFEDAIRYIEEQAPDAAQRVFHLVSEIGVPGSADVVVRTGVGQLMLLTAHHVALAETAKLGASVFTADDNSDEQTRFGEVLRAHLGAVAAEAFVDCALIAPLGPIDIPVLPGRKTVAASTGLAVRKWGAATGYTTGSVVDSAFHDRPRFGGRRLSAPRQILVRSDDPAINFAAPGDSGAGLYDADGNVVGLIWGVTSSGDGVACPIKPVLEQLDVSLAGDDA